MQFIVISLKTGFFQGSETLVGVYRDQGANSSKALTLDVSHSSTIPPFSGLNKKQITDFTNTAAEISILMDLSLFVFHSCFSNSAFSLLI